MHVPTVDAHIFCCMPNLHLALAVCLRARPGSPSLGIYSSSLRRRLQIRQAYGSFLASSSPPARETAVRNPIIYGIDWTEEDLGKTLHSKVPTTLVSRLIIHSLPNNRSLIHHTPTVPTKTPALTARLRHPAWVTASRSPIATTSLYE